MSRLPSPHDTRHTPTQWLCHPWPCEGTYKTTGNRRELKRGFWVDTHQSLECSLEGQRPEVLLWPSARWSSLCGKTWPT